MRWAAKNFGFSHILRNSLSFPAYMTVEFFARMNLVDILMMSMCVWCIYVGARQGILAEFCKLLGMFFSTFITLHYFPSFARFLKRTFAIPDALNVLLSFVFLWLVVVVLFNFVREGWGVMLRGEPHPVVNRIGGMLLAFPRAMLICGMMFMLLFVSNHENMAKQARTSVAAFYFIDFSPVLYRGIFDTVISRFFPGERINDVVFTLKEAKRKRSSF
jgi:uncharacterized membrane protein required for colicin V production